MQPLPVSVRAAEDLVQPVGTLPDCKHTYFYYCFRVDLDRLRVDGEGIVRALAAEGLPCELGYPGPIPLYLYQMIREWRKTVTLRVGYIGAGIMGGGIVKNLRKKDFPVSFVVHRNRDRVPELLAAGAVEVPDYASLAAASDVIMLTLPDSSVVEPVLLGEGGIGPHLRAGQTVVDMSTSYPESTRQVAAALAARGIDVLDAPLTGSRPHAESGTLNVMCGGPVDAYERVKPLFDAIASNVFHVGPVGSGHAIKLINNYLGQVSVAAICEVLPLAEKYGVDLQALFDVVSVSGGNSRQFQGLMPRLMKRDFGVSFQQKFVHKDLRYVTTLAREQRIPTPLASALLAIHDMALAKGYGEQDFSALLKFMEELSGVRVGGPGKAD